MTSPGHAGPHLVTDLGVFAKGDDDTFVLTSVAAGEGSVAERVEQVRALCGWPLVVAPSVTETAPPEPAEIEALRRWDPQGRFLR